MRPFAPWVAAEANRLKLFGNPFDNIATLSRWHHQNSIDQAIKGYFDRCSAIQKIKESTNSNDWLDIYHDAVITSPSQVLPAACQFLGVEVTTDYLKDCASIVFKEPRRRRFEIKWADCQRRTVEDHIRQYDHLSKYGFDS